MYSILETWLSFPADTPQYVVALAVMLISSIFFINIIDIIKILLYHILRR